MNLAFENFEIDGDECIIGMKNELENVSVTVEWFANLTLRKYTVH